MKRNIRDVSAVLCLGGILSMAGLADAALVNGTILTIDQGSGTCTPVDLTTLNCDNLQGSYFMGGLGSQTDSGVIFWPSSYALLEDGYDDVTGAFNGGPLGGMGIILGQTQPYDGDSVSDTTPYDPSTGQNITTAWVLKDISAPDTYGTNYTNAPIVDNGDGTLDFSGWDAAWNTQPSTPGLGGGSNTFIGGTATIFTTATGGAYGAGTYVLDYFVMWACGEFECPSYALHLEGSIKPVPLPAVLTMFVSGLGGLLGFAYVRA
ncbi:MAG TPA: hypothetical protein ENK29_01125 [Chromatiales bacterium]|nr:hypothetical protein [Chromatiales bacterium]